MEFSRCPSCAGKAYGEQEMNRQRIRCRDCGMESGLYATREEARAAWNRRRVCNLSIPKLAMIVVAIQLVFGLLAAITLVAVVAHYIS